VRGDPTGLEIGLGTSADGHLVIRLVGELDASTGSRLTEILRERLDAGGVDHIEFDWTDLSFVDSTGLAVIIRAFQAGARVTVRRPNRSARRILTITGFDSLVDIVEAEQPS
jgi:anti-anti-sigma factor